MRFLTQLTWIFGVLTLTGSSALPTLAGDPVQNFESFDTEMNAAIANAQASLDLFLDHNLDADRHSIGTAAIKVRFSLNRQSNDTEIIWISPFASIGDDRQEFAGRLLNDPNWIPGKSKGDIVEFSPDMIVDWSALSENGQLLGNFTTRVQLLTLDVRYYWLREDMAKDPIPDTWQ